METLGQTIELFPSLFYEFRSENTHTSQSSKIEIDIRRKMPHFFIVTRKEISHADL